MEKSHQDAPVAALISMPWSIFNRPSIQLGTLKAYAEQRAGIQTVCFHPYLRIAKAVGTENYATLAINGWAGEALFSALLFPEMRENAHRVYRESLGRKRNELPSFSTLSELLRDACNDWVRETDWSRFTTLGFTLCFNQLLASLYMAAELKNREKCPPIVFGGSSCTGAAGRSMLRQFPQVDYVIDGEGEIPFVALCEFLSGRAGDFPERVFGNNEVERSRPCPEIADLNQLPAPDYGPYFAEMQQVFSGEPFIPEIPVEFSRGCWWNKCTFCNLNQQWQGYRWKTGEVMFREITGLARRYQCLDFTFTDNALPPRESSSLAGLLQSRQEDYRFFAEIRATTTPRTLHEYGEMGIRSIQVGIEAVAPTLLQKFRKGVGVIDNIAVMKYAMAENIVLDGNLIIEFPGSTEQEVRDTVHNLDYVLPFNPLKTAVFFLGYGSPVYESPEAYGIKTILTHRKSKQLFPASCLENLELLIKDYRGDRGEQRKLWRPVIEKVNQWHDFHAKRANKGIKPLTYRCGNDFIIIRQERPGAAALTHRLKGASGRIYRFCDEIRTLDEVYKQFSNLKSEAVLGFIDQLCGKRLMFREQDRVISLAVRRDSAG